MSWGTSGWGLSLLGSEATSISLSSAVATSIRTVKVTLSSEPTHSSFTLAGDALNPATWAVTRVDNSFAFTVLTVEQIDLVTYDITVLEPFYQHLVNHRVQSSILLSKNGYPITSPYIADFDGVVTLAALSPYNQAADRNLATRDFANPPAPVGSTSLGGTLLLTTTGDYQNVTGAELVKKLIIRRIVTQPRGFFHLLDYGIGVAVKEPIPLSDLVALRTNIEKQIREEPEIENAQAFITVSNDNVLTIKVAATLKTTGEQITVGVNTKASVSF